MTYLPYTGVGSRETPEPILERMTHIAEVLADLGFTLRSGAADGADTAFESGVSNPNLKEIFLPWKGFNGSLSPLHGWPSPTVEKLARAIAMSTHPNWSACSEAAQKLHMRNVAQVLGHDLESRSLFVICWTPKGRGTGGTGQAVRLARQYDIPVFDFGENGIEKTMLLLEHEVGKYIPAHT